MIEHSDESYEHGAAHADGGAHEHDHPHDNGHLHDHDHAEARLARLAGMFVGHSHDPGDSIDDALGSDARGIRALKLSLLLLGIIAVAQLAVVLVSGSVALPADTIHVNPCGHAGEDPHALTRHHDPLAGRAAEATEGGPAR